MHVDSVVMERVAVPAVPATGLRSPVWMAVLLPFVALVIWRARYGVGLEGDDYGQYLMHARALIDGRPYSDINYIYSRYAPWIGPRAAPPGLPMILAAAQIVFGANVIVVKLTMMAFATSFVLLAGLYFARAAGQAIGWSVALLCGLSPALLHNASQPLTDLPFAAVVWLTIYLMDSDEPFSWTKIVAVTVLGGFAVLIRPTGIALGGTVLLYALLNRRAHGFRPAVPFLIWGVGLLAIAALTHIGRSALIQVSPRLIMQWVWVEKLPLVNLREYGSATLASHLDPFPMRGANDLFHAATGSLMLIGLAAWARRAWRSFAFLFAVCYSLLLLIMPLSHIRYLWPLYPVFVFGLLNGIRVFASFALGSPTRAPSFALAFALLLAPLGVVRALAAPAPLNFIAVPDIREVFSYVEATAAHEPMRVTFFKPRALGWTTGVPAMGPLRGKPECLLAELRDQRITHVIVGSLGGRFNSDLRRTVAMWPRFFSRQLENKMFTVYRFRPDATIAPAPVDCL